MNSRYSNVKLKGQMLIKFYESDIHGKLMEQGINEINVDKMRKKSLFKNQQKYALKFGRKRCKFRFLNSNYLSKSNLNYINCKGYKGITLIT